MLIGKNLATSIYSDAAPPEWQAWMRWFLTVSRALLHQGQFAGIVLGGCSVLIGWKKGDHAKTDLDERFKRFVAGEGVVEYPRVPQHS